MKISLFYEFPLPRPWTEDDEHKLFQHGLDEVEAADKAGTVELTIEDNGDGPDGSLGTGGRGGFGLTLIRGLAMQLGGEAQISAREGGGMRVAVTFPMPQDEEAGA